MHIKRMLSLVAGVLVLILISSYAKSYVLKTVYDGKVKLKIPNDFVTIEKGEPIFDAVFTTKKPDIGFWDATNKVRIGLEKTKHNLTQDKVEESAKNYIVLMKEMVYGDGVEIIDFKIKEKKGKKIGFIKMVFQEEEPKTLMSLFITDLDNKMLVGAMEYKGKEIDEWSAVFDKIMKTVEVE